MFNLAKRITQRDAGTEKIAKGSKKLVRRRLYGLLLAVCICTSSLTFALGPSAEAQAADYTFDEIAFWSGSTLLGVAQNNAHWWGYSIVQDFNRGSWGWFLRANTGSNTPIYFVRGGMRGGWVANNGSAGLLRGPKNDEYAFAGGARQDFVGGSLIWRSGFGNAVPATSVAGANAVGKAWSQIGSKTGTSSTSTWYWSGNCEWFCKWSYGSQYPSGLNYTSAIAHYNDLKSKGRIVNNGSTPPPGAIVFYNLSSWGHAAISAGGGEIVTTMGNTGANLAVAKQSLGYFGSYLGYSLQP